MTHEMRITTDGSERSIVRTLAVIEQRGFQVSAIDFPYTETGEQRFRVCVIARDGHRSIEALAGKIAAMYTVKHVEVGASDSLRYHNQKPVMVSHSIAVNGSHALKEVVQ